MNISSADFRDKNQIMFQTKILRSGWDKEQISQCLRVDREHPGLNSFKDADVIDINQNNKGDTRENYGIMQSDMFFTEPVLVQSMDEIKTIAQEKGTEVVTKDTADLKTQDQGVIVQDGFYMSFQSVQGRQTPLDNVVKEIFPRDRFARWAIDTTTDEFMIYRPK